MSYHNGSVWPHDNALIALGLARYGLQDDAVARLRGPLRRRAAPSCAACRSCSAASSAARIAARRLSGRVLAAGLGGGATSAAAAPASASSWRTTENEIRFRDPVMPDFLDEVIIRNIRLGGSRADLRLHRYGHDVTANVLSREGSLRVVLLK